MYVCSPMSYLTLKNLGEVKDCASPNATAAAAVAGLYTFEAKISPHFTY